MSKKKKKKLILIVITSVLAIFIIFVITYNVGLKSVSGSTDKVSFKVSSGESRTQIISELKNDNIIKSEFSASIYLYLHHLNLQAGKYSLDRSHNTKELLKQMADGITGDDTINITFIEGKRITEYASIISSKLGLNYDDVLSTFKSQDIAKEMMAKYSFLSDKVINANIYYPLEGYLFPDTYSFYKDATTEDIIDKMLKEEKNKLDSLQTNIDNSKYSLHDLVTIASIVELEGKNATDRSKIAQVIYTRLDKEMPLEMDTTTYYAVQKSLTENLTVTDLASSSLYNTRNKSIIGLPVGPICNPSFESLTATLNPSDTDYIYFYASKDGTVKFTNDYNEFLVFKNEG